MPTIDWLKQEFHYGYRSGDILNPTPDAQRAEEQQRCGADYRNIFLSTVAPLVPRGGTVLELGPGGGSWTRAFLQAIPECKIVTCDFQNAAEWLMPQDWPGRLTCHQVQDTTFGVVGDRSIDLFFSFGVLCHNNASSIESILKNALGKMKPGAMALHQYGDWQKLDAFGWERGTVPVEFSDKPDDDIWWPRNNAWNMAKLARKVGWEVVCADLGHIERDGFILLRAPEPSTAETFRPQDAAEDAYDRAYQWGWSEPSMRENVRLCYKTPDAESNARRFYASFEFRETVRVLEELGKAPETGARVLDFGCGNGVASWSLAKAGYQVVGMDSSPGLMAGLGAAVRLQGLDGMAFELHRSRGEDLAYPDHSFDVVWMREVLHHIVDLPAFLAKVHKILRPGGILCCLRDVVVWNESQREHFFRAHPFNRFTNDENCHQLQEYLDGFESAGFDELTLLDPVSSPINSYPAPFLPGLSFDEEASRRRTEGYDLFSFFARKGGIQAGPAATPVQAIVSAPAARPRTSNVPTSHPRPHSLALQPRCGEDSWGAVTLVPATLAARASQPETWEAILAFHHLLAHDEYVKYTDGYYRQCLERYGEDWKFWDIINILYTASDLIKPRKYLEIGVRRGRSACTVARACPDVEIAAFDMWISGYGNMENPGPEFVRSELARNGHTGAIQFIEGNSHETVPEYFRTHPGTTFDLITVDGDHSEVGAERDLMDVVPHLSVGGILVFDDISHPAHPYLRDVWKRVTARFPNLATFEWGEAGYGVAFAIRRS